MSDFINEYNASCLQLEEDLNKWEQKILDLDKNNKDLEKEIREMEKNIIYWRRIGVNIIKDDWLLEYMTVTDKNRIKLNEVKKELGNEKRRLAWAKKKADKQLANHLITLHEASCK